MTKFVFPILIFLYLLLSPGCNPSAPVEDNPVKGILARLFPGYEDRFVFETLPPINHRDCFEIEPGPPGKIIIRGNSPVSTAAGLNWYLKYSCKASISWCGCQPDLPSPLPPVPTKIRKESPFKYGYYLNYCTFSYSMPFWDWNRWEQEIDWMALNGVNLPLAAVGSEAVWQRTLAQFNFNDAEIKEFVSGPAFLAWWLMGNLEGWGGPLPQSWIDEHADLQKKILARLREFGMEPVLPGFYGMVPNRLKEKYPQSQIVDQGYWAGDFKRPAFLVPTDPLFAKMADTYYREQKKLYGDCRFFSADPFHEGELPRGIDIPACGKEIMAAMHRCSPGSVWVLQGWQGNPRDELLSGLVPDDTLILDLDSDNRPQWKYRSGWNHRPWVWCIIQNFGGNVGMFGRMDIVASEPVQALLHENPGRVMGIGAAPEGIESNPVIYDLLFEMRWHDRSPNLYQWLKEYAHRRYGRDLPQLRRAWQILRRTVYGKKFEPPDFQDDTNESIFCARPSKQLDRVSTWRTSRLYYDLNELVDAWRLFISASAKLEDSSTFQYDLVDLTRQVLANFGQKVYFHMIYAFEKKNRDAFLKYSDLLIGLIIDQDRLLSTREKFRLGPWLASARKWGKNEAESDLYEFNARTLITTWSFKDSNLRDYSHREWAGLLKDFYLPRWQMFIAELKEQLKGKAPGKIDYYEFEREWTRRHNFFPVEPVGNPVKIAREMYEKYRLGGLFY